MGRPITDLTGKRFGRLIVLGLEFVKGQSHWRCKCQCGKETVVQRAHLKSGTTKSCGCLREEINRTPKHGETNTPVYGIWSGIKFRCNNPDSQAYKYYGARGIKMCDEWEDDYPTFKKWMVEQGYKKGLTVERIDFNKGYTPDNCRLVPLEEQTKNTRRNLFVEYKGKKMIMKDWSRELNINYRTLLSRYRNGDRGAKLFRSLDRIRAK